MKKLTTILLISAFSILFTSGCWIGKKGEESSDEVAEEIITAEDITAEDITEEDVVEPDAELDENIEALIEIIADEDADSSSCEVLGDEDLQQSCEQTFIYSEAVASGDESLCADLLNEYDVEKCIEEIAQ